MSYVRVSILGASPGNEVWSVNPVFDPSGEFPGGVDQTALDAAANAIVALVPGAGLLSFMSTALTITAVRLEVREDADDSLIAISNQVRGTPIPGTGTPSRPGTTAIVFSLRTDTPGGSGRGRMYWPAVSAALDPNLRFSAASVSNGMDAMKLYLTAIRSALATAFPTIGFDLAVRSRTTRTTPHVNKIQVGNVPDNQRRRKDALVEDYVSVSFP